MLDYALARKGLTRIKALAHPLRLSIISFIDKNGEINVNKIYRSLKLEQSVASQHLAILRQANVVKTERDGKFIYYSLNEERISELADLVEELANQ